MGIHEETRLPLRLAAFTFDPVEEKLDLPEELRVEEPVEVSTHYIVQFRKSLTREEQAHVQGEYGLKLTDYIPEFAYLEMMSVNNLEKLTSDPLFRASVPYHPAFKLDPQIGKRSFVSPRRVAEPGILLMIVAFEGADLDALVNSVRALGFKVVSRTDEPNLNIRRIKVRVRQPADAPQIAQLPGVRYVEEVGDVTLNNSTTSWVIQTNVANSRTVWIQGLRGEGQIIGHIDGLIDMNHCFFRDVINNTPNPAHRKVVGLRNACSGTALQSHGTFSAGCAAGEDINNDALSAAPNANNGNAPRARLTHGYLYDLDYQPGGTVSFYNYLVQAHNDGAHIHTNSWDDKSTSAYTQLSVDLDAFTWEHEDDLVIIGPDNDGTIRPPDTAKNALVVNATQQSPNQDNFSCGITQFSLDGRRKPDLMAPGQNIVSADDGTDCGTRIDSGTSFAAPAVAGAAALVRQYYTEGWYPTGTRQPHHAFIPSGALLKATLLNATVDMTSLADYPGTAATGEGWGRLLLENTLYFQGEARNQRVWDTRHIDGLTTGVIREHHVDVASNAQPLKITLVWTDPPGAANSANTVVNNLDLEVISPNGAQTFRGNVFAGGVSTTVGAADTLNNVEMILVNTPDPGDWTVRVIGTQVNVGNPGQGYALTVTGDLTKPPVVTGLQNTLVVPVKFADVALEPSLSSLQSLMADVADYIHEVSYGQTTVVPDFRGPLTLDHNKDYYYHPDRNLLIELTEEVVAKLVVTEPNLFNNFGRMIIVTNDVNFTDDWATTGSWPYQLPAGFTQPTSVSIQSYANQAARFNHGMLHQFGLIDLYAHDGVTFPRPYVDEWDNMAGFYNNVHPLVWSKERAGWLTAHGDTIQYVPRPAPSDSYTIPIFNNTSTAANNKAIAIGLTQGAATLAAENAFYFVEARSNAAGTYDDALPGSGVLIYYVNERILQGEGPVILRDKNHLLTQGLNDAFYSVDDEVTIPGTGITLTVQAGTAGADFNIQVDYAAPVPDYNVSIISQDIWVDSPKNGFNLGEGPPPHYQRERPVPGEVNRIYARVHNTGPATAFDFDVRFRISEPYHTVGGEADFDKFVGIKHIASLAPGTHSDVYVEWTPVTEVEPHACVKVDLINLVGTDTNEHDNWAQENLDIEQYDVIIAGGSGLNGELILRGTADQDRISLSASNAAAVLGGNGEPGNLALFSSTTDHDNSDNDFSEATIHLNGGSGCILAGGNGGNGNLVLRDADGQNRISLRTDIAAIALGGSNADGTPGADGDLLLFPSTQAHDSGDPEFATIHLNGENGDLVLRDADGQDRIRLSASNADAGEERIHLDADNGNIIAGGNDQDGDLILKDADGRERIRLSASDEDTNVGELILKDAGGQDRIHLRDVGELVLRNINGQDRIHLGAVSADIHVGGNREEGNIRVFPSSGDNATLEQATILLNGEQGDIVAGGNDVDGNIRLFPGTATNNTDASQATIRLDAHQEVEADDDSRVISIITAGGNNTDGVIRLFPSTATDNTVAPEATIRLNANAGIITAGGNEVDGVIRLFPSTATDNTDPGQARISLRADIGAIALGGRNADETAGHDGDLALFSSTTLHNATHFDEASIHLDGNKGEILMRNASDAAEDFDVADPELIEPGTVVVIDEQSKLRQCTREYDKCAAGVISGAGDLRPGIILGRDCSRKDRLPVALIGKVICKVDAQYGAIQVGDLLTTSPNPGHAMKASDPTAAFGAVIGKSLSPLREGQGLIPILVALQ